MQKLQEMPVCNDQAHLNQKLFSKTLPVVSAFILYFTVAVSSFGQVSVTTYHNDNGRTGQNAGEKILTPANVNKTLFGKLFSVTVDGYLYGQPLYLPKVTIPGKGIHNVVYVATEHDSVYAFDADSNAGANASPLWKVSFINSAKGITTVSSSNAACNDIVPEIGITSTPVIDATTGTIYVVVKTRENGQYFQRLHALNVTTGAEKFGGPVAITATVQGKNGTKTFDPLRANQRSGLLLQNGNIYIAWASHCDNGPYNGWLISYSASTLARTGVWNATPNGTDGGIWMSGAAPAGDSTFNTYVSTGNGTFDANSAGPDFGNSIVKLSPPVAGKFTAVDFFTPFNEQALNNGDTDLGSGGIMLLPTLTGMPHSQMLLQGGKEGTLYLIDRTKMGHFNASGDTQIVQSIPGTSGGVYSTPAWWNNNVYVGGKQQALQQLTLNSTNGTLQTPPKSKTATLYSFPAATPSISANGTTNGIVWAIQSDAANAKGKAILHAYNALDVSKELYNSNQVATRDNPGIAVKFTVPTIANGKVYVGTAHALSVYGLLP